MKHVWKVFTIIMVLVTTVIGESTPKSTPIVVKPKEKVVFVKHYHLYEDGVRIDSTRATRVGSALVIDRMVPHVKKLLRAAKRDTVDLKLMVGYRSFEEQLIIRIAHAKDRKKILNLDFLLNAHPKYFYPATGKPGHSKHHNGIAYDFNLQNNPPAYEWMVKNAFKYGFVRTVPSEIWHWEYLPRTQSPYSHVKEDHPSWIF